MNEKPGLLEPRGLTLGALNKMWSSPSKWVLSGTRISVLRDCPPIDMMILLWYFLMIE